VSKRKQTALLDDQNVTANTEFDALKTQIKEMEMKLKEVVEANKGRDNVRKVSKSDVTCFNCRQKGHFSRDCPKRRTGYGRYDGRGGQGRDIDRGDKGNARGFYYAGSSNSPLN
jgi:hypothetical protein